MKSLWILCFFLPVALCAESSNDEFDLDQIPYFQEKKVEAAPKEAEPVVKVPDGAKKPTQEKVEKKKLVKDSSTRMKPTEQKPVVKGSAPTAAPAEKKNNNSGASRFSKKYEADSED